MSRKRKDRKTNVASAQSVPAEANGADASTRLSRLDWLIAVTLAVAALIVFSSTWSFDFTNWDDGPYITLNRNLLDAAGLGRIWFSGDNEQYYPLTFTTFWLEHQLWGDNPIGYHVVNTILHALNVMLVLVLCRRMGLSTLMSSGVAALFAMHPIQAMTVAWVAERKTLLACFFILLATNSWLNYVCHHRRASYVSSLMFFGLALLSKSAVLLAPLAWLPMATLLNQPIRRSLLSILPMLALAGIAALVTRRFESDFIDAQALTMIPTLLHRILLAGTAVWWYVLAIFFPVRLAPVYPLWNIETAQIFWWLGFVALAAAVTIVLTFRNRIDAVVRSGLAWFVLMLLPTLGLLAYGNLAVTPVSNHYVYIPCIGLFLAVGWFLDHWRARNRNRTRALATVLFCTVVVSVLAVRSEAGDFRNSKSLWSAALARDPQCFAAHLGLGQEALGDKDLPLALEHYSSAVRLRPTQYEGHAALGEVYIRMQNWPEARASIDTALKLRPDHVPALLARATLAEHDGDMAAALEFVRRANDLDAHNPRAAVQLGVLLLRMVNTERTSSTSRPVDDPKLAEARTAFDRVIQLRPDDVAGYRGAVECARLRRDWASAISTARAGLTVAPDSIPLKNLLAITLARCPDDRLRDGPAAVRLAEEIAPALGGNNVQLLETLASAYAAVGRFPQAASASREAARLANEAGNDAAVRVNAQWAAQYDAGQPRLD